MNENEKSCPDCAETVKKAARVCRHCGHRFLAPAAEDAVPEVPSTPAAANAGEIVPPDTVVDGGSVSKKSIAIGIAITIVIWAMFASKIWREEGWRLSGYDTEEQMEAAESGGFTDKETFLAAQAAGISSAEEWSDFSALMSENGFDDASEFIAWRENKRAEREAERNNSCKMNWRRCSDNKDLVSPVIGYSGLSNIRLECQRTLNSLSRFGDPEWFHGGGAFFGGYYPGDDYVRTGIIHLIHDDIRIPNAFGAMVRSQAHCIYDLNREQVVNTYTD